MAGSRERESREPDPPCPHNHQTRSLSLRTHRCLRRPQSLIYPGSGGPGAPGASLPGSQPEGSDQRGSASRLGKERNQW